MQPLISICIPAYKNEIFFKRLMDSIVIQNFKDFEVIITDDSPDKSISYLCDKYKNYFPLVYYWNESSLGTPANWNYAISKAKGDWIKIMHADDWFESENSLLGFAQATKLGFSFIFSEYYNINLDNNSYQKIKLSKVELSLLKASPYNLFKKNTIGPPSTTLIKRSDNKLLYDENIKWVVDFEYYIRYLSLKNSFTYIAKPLVNIGIHEGQVTKKSFRIKEVEIPENIYLINKIETKHLKNIFVFDYYWRLLRNLRITDIEDFSPFIDIKTVPIQIKKMMKIQSYFSFVILKKGIFSKTLMSIFFLLNYVKKA